MPTMAFGPDEILLLSALAPQRPAFPYPLHYLLDRGESFTEAAAREMHDAFVRDGLLWRDREGCPQLNGEMAVAFGILNHPETAVHIQAFAREETPRYVLCARKDRWVLLTVGKDDALFALTYPFSADDCADWFGFDLLGREEFRPPYFTAREITLTSLELALLSVVQGIFRSRVEARGGRLGEGEQWIGWDEFFDPANAARAERVLPCGLDEGKFAALFAEREAVRGAMAALEREGVLRCGERGVTFSPLGRVIFDPGKVANMFVLTKPGVINQYRTLQVYAGGFLVLRPLMRERGRVSLLLLPGDLAGREVFSRLTDWEEDLLSLLPAGTGAGPRPPVSPPARTCPGCGNPVRGGARFCRNCGIALRDHAASSPAGACPSCGNRVRGGARFCRNCGYPLY